MQLKLRNACGIVYDVFLTFFFRKSEPECYERDIRAVSLVPHAVRIVQGQLSVNERYSRVF